MNVLYNDGITWIISCQREEFRMKKNWAEIVSYLLLVLTVILAYIDDHDIFTDKSMAGTMMILCILSCGFRMLDIYNKNKDK